MNLREHGVAVNREYQELVRNMSINPKGFTYSLSLEAARVILENKLDRARLQWLIDKRGWAEFVEKTDRNLKALLASSISALNPTAVNAGLGLGLGMAAGWVLGAAFAPITGGASFFAMTSLGASGALWGGLYGFTKTMGSWHDAYSTYSANRQDMISIVARALRETYTAEEMLDRLLGTDLLLAPWDDDSIIAIDVYAGLSLPEYNKKLAKIQGYRLASVFGDDAFAGHFVWWHKSMAMPSELDLENHLICTRKILLEARSS